MGVGVNRVTLGPEYMGEGRFFCRPIGHDSAGDAFRWPIIIGPDVGSS